MHTVLNAKGMACVDTASLGCPAGPASDVPGSVFSLVLVN